MNSRRLHPPETPQGTGATGGGSNGDGVHSEKSFCIRGKIRLHGFSRGTIPPRCSSDFAPVVRLYRH